MGEVGGRSGVAGRAKGQTEGLTREQTKAGRQARTRTRNAVAAVADTSALVAKVEGAYLKAAPLRLELCVSSDVKTRVEARPARVLQAKDVQLVLQGCRAREVLAGGALDKARQAGDIAEEARRRRNFGCAWDVCK